MLLVCKCVPTNSRGEACDTGAVDILVKLKDPRSQDAHVIEVQEESKQFMSEFFERVGCPSVAINLQPRVTPCGSLSRTRVLAVLQVALRLVARRPQERKEVSSSSLGSNELSLRGAGATVQGQDGPDPHKYKCDERAPRKNHHRGVPDQVERWAGLARGYCYLLVLSSVPSKRAIGNMCVCVCSRGCTHAHMHTCTHAHMHACTHAHTHTCVYVCMCIFKMCYASARRRRGPLPPPLLASFPLPLPLPLPLPSSLSRPLPPLTGTPAW